jgi:hypothetical protein
MIVIPGVSRAAWRDVVVGPGQYAALGVQARLRAPQSQTPHSERVTVKKPGMDVSAGVRNDGTAKRDIYIMTQNRN